MNKTKRAVILAMERAFSETRETYVTAGEIWSAYQKLPPLFRKEAITTERALYNVLKDIEADGQFASEVVSTGRYGKTTRYSAVGRKTT